MRKAVQLEIQLACPCERNGLLPATAVTFTRNKAAAAPHATAIFSKTRYQLFKMPFKGRPHWQAWELCHACVLCQT